MPRLTLYLDAQTQALVTAQAKAAGLSKSRWVAELIRRHAHGHWPEPGWSEPCRALAGAFADFSLREEAPTADAATEVRRIGF